MYSYFETVAGHQFTEATVPQLIEAMNRLASAIEEQNRIAREQQQGKETSTENALPIIFE